ncbi:uncharacterized protein [Lepisosteus oculatus]|uniref:uncharacterized protein n=1 Tax=Lepisosteus oculatus TaxID=7918 RepID=UPI0037175A3A
MGGHTSLPCSTCQTDIYYASKPFDSVFKAHGQLLPDSLHAEIDDWLKSGKCGRCYERYLRDKERDKEMREQEERRNMAEERRKHAEERRKMAEERRKHAEKERQWEEEKKQMVRRRLEGTREETDRRCAQERRRRAEEIQQRHGQVVREMFQGRRETLNAGDSDSDKGLLNILSRQLGIPEAEIDLRKLSPQQVLSLSLSLQELLFDDWVDHTPLEDTLLHTQVLITELCVIVLDTSEDGSLETAADQLQLIVETLVKVVREGEGQCLYFTQALFLTYTQLLETCTETQLTTLSIAVAWTQGDISTEQLFLLKVLELLLRAMEERNGTAVTGEVRGEEEKCLELILDALVQTSEGGAFCRLTASLLGLLGTGRWTCTEVLRLLDTLVQKPLSPEDLLRITDLVKGNDLSPFWTGSEGCSLDSLLESEHPDTEFRKTFEEKLRREGDRILESHVSRLRESGCIDAATAEVVKGVVGATQREFEDNLNEIEDNENEAKLLHSVFKGSLKGIRMEAAELERVLSALSRAVFQTQGYWPTVAQLVSWCVLAVSGTDRPHAVIPLQIDPCVVAMYAALKVLQGERVGVVLRSASSQDHRPQNWTSFFQLFGITVNMSCEEVLDEDFQDDIVYGTVETSFMRFLQQGPDVKTTGSSPQPRHFILDQDVSKQDLQFRRMSTGSELMKNMATILTTLLQPSVNSTERKTPNLNLIMTVFHTFSVLDHSCSSSTCKERLTGVCLELSHREITKDEIYVLRFLETVCNLEDKQHSTLIARQCFDLLTTYAITFCPGEDWKTCLWKLLDLVRQGLWTPAEITDFFYCLVKKFREEKCTTDIADVKIHSQYDNDNRNVNLSSQFSKANNAANAQNKRDIAWEFSDDFCEPNDRNTKTESKTVLSRESQRGGVLISIMKVLQMVEMHRVSPSFRDRHNYTLTQLLDIGCHGHGLLFTLKDYLTTKGEKNLEEVLQEIQETGETETTTIKKVRDIVTSVQEQIKNSLKETAQQKKTYFEMFKQKVDRLKKLFWKKSFHGFNRGCLTGHSLGTEELQTALVVLCSAVYETQGWWPRATQMVSWCLLALSASGKLLELGTGEGKSCVVAMFTAYRVLRGESVDVLSSSPILAQSDAQEWRTFYGLFGIAIDSNTDKTTDKSRKECYQCDVVYGIADSFAADCLRQSFETKDIRPRRQFQCAIVDEVDSLPLDKGVQMTYLSTDMAPMQHLNIVLAMIWSIVSQHGFVATENGPMVRGPVLPFNRALFDSIDMEGVEPADILQMAEEEGLIQKGFTSSYDKLETTETSSEDPNIGILKEKLRTVSQDDMVQIFQIAHEYFPYRFTTYTQDKTRILCLCSHGNTSEGEDLPEVSFLLLEEGLCCGLYDKEEPLWEAVEENVRNHLFFTSGQTVEKQEQKTCVPGFLRELVEKKLSVWVQNAFLALKVQEGQEYIVEDSRVLPVDFGSTGVVEKNKKWGNGLQQFLEMKHQTTLSCMSLVTNFLSNVAFFRKYEGQIFGTTGTLGTQEETELLRKLYPGLSTCRIPPFNGKKLYEVEGVIEKDVDEWRRKICSSVLQQTKPAAPCTAGRAALVICETIKQAEDIHRALSEQLKEEEGKEHLKLYVNSNTDNSSITDKALRPGDVIVATNLAGRGTDLKVTDEVNEAGGLFVVLTFLPQNARVELQAFGRTARKGNPGSAQLLLCLAHLREPVKSAPTLQQAREARNQLARDRVSRVLQDDIPELSLREELFSEYCEHLQDIYSSFPESKSRRVMVAVLNEYWGIWLLNKTEEMSAPDMSALDRLRRDLREKMEEAEQKCQTNQSPSSSIYQYIKFGNKLLYKKKWEESSELFSKAIELDSSWAAIALYKRAYCTLKKQDQDYFRRAKEDLEKALHSVELFTEQCLTTLQLVKLSEKDSGQSTTAFQRQTQVRIQVLSNVRINIKEAMEKLTEIEQKKKDILIEESSIFSLVKDPESDVHEVLYRVYQLGLELVFSVKEKPRFCWEGLIVFLLGVAQIALGTVLILTTTGILLTVGSALISEGISDCITGTTAMVTGEFSWTSWIIGKAVSLAVSLVGYGLGKLLSKGMSACKAGVRGLNKLKSLPKVISRQCKGGMTGIMKENLKNALKYAGKEVVQQTIMCGVSKAEEIAIDQICGQIRHHIRDKVFETVENNIASDPLGPLVDSVVVSHITENEDLGLLLADEENRRELLGIFQTACGTVLESHCSGLGWQQQLNTSIHNIVKKAKHGNNATANSVLTLIQVAHMATLCGDAVPLAMDLCREFDSQYCEELEKTWKRLKKKVEQKGLSGGDKANLVSFKEEITKMISSALGDAIFQIVHQKFSSHMVSLAQEQINGKIGQLVSSTLKTSRTREKLEAGLHTSYIASAPESHRHATEEDLIGVTAYAMKMTQRTADGPSNSAESNSLATLLEAKLLAESSSKTVVIYTENSRGKRSKMTVVHPNKSTEGTVELLYHPKSDRCPNGHYEALINGRVVEVSGQRNNCLYEAFARSHQPTASSDTISSVAAGLREKAVQMSLSDPGKWAPLIKRKERVLNIRGGGWFMAEGGGEYVKETQEELEKHTGRVGKYKDNQNYLHENGIGKFMNADHQPAVDSVVEAYFKNPESPLVKGLIHMWTDGKYQLNNPPDKNKFRSQMHSHGRNLPTVLVLRDLHRAFPTTCSKEFRQAVAEYISKDDVEGFLKMAILGAAPNSIYGKSGNGQNTNLGNQRVSIYTNKFQQASLQVIEVYRQKLQESNFMDSNQLEKSFERAEHWVNNKQYNDQSSCSTDPENSEQEKGTQQ